MNEEHYMNMTRTNLAYAKNELTAALKALDNFININNMNFYDSKITNIGNTINRQINDIENYIVPDIRAMYKGN